jgi:hypothetical protein
MQKTILFNVASKSRPHKFNRVVNYIYDNCNQPFIILAKVDDDDQTKDAYDLSRVIHIGGYSDNKISAINKGIPKEGWDIITDFSDDFVITKKGFDNIIREHCGPDDCLHFPEPFAVSQNKNNRNEDIIIMACMGRDYYNRFGYIFNPVYKSLFADNENTAVAKKLCRYKFVDEQIFYHAHPAAGYGKADAQTKHTESFWKEDQKTFNERKKLNFPL